MSKNIFTWVEIYVDNMERARKFYEEVLKLDLVPMEMPGGMDEYQMVSFPWIEDGPNISGALVSGPMGKPGAGGTVVYLTCEDCSVEESRVEKAGGKVHQTKFSIGDYGYCSICEDTEGNIFGLHSMK
ncbi:MAG: VOC family protein [Saprospirales bacterium]|nr:MAG: VOC family protein [Saprospirales bacterium]